MQFFERSSVKPPAFLSSKEVVEARAVIRDFLLLEHKERSQTVAPVSGVVLDNHDVLSALSTLFRGKCAFCERFYPSVRHHRFRPVANALPTKRVRDHHLYYSWLSLAWENIYPICRKCIPHRPDYFPVNGPRARLPTRKQLDMFVKSNLGLWGDYPVEEHNLYLDPCMDKSFHEHLHIDHKGVLRPMSVEGSMTIQAFNLDRHDLQMQRSERLKGYLNEFLSQGRDSWISGYPSVIKLLDFPALEFGGLWYLQCRQIAVFLSKKALKSSDLSLKQIPKTFGLIARRPGFQDALDGLTAQITESDFGYESQLATLRSKFVEPDAPPLEYGSLYAVELENFKSIEHLKIRIPQDHPKPSTVSESLPQVPALLILGENAAGKSSVLEAIALALADGRTRNSLGIDHQELILNPSLLGSKGGAPIRKAKVTLRFQKQRARVMKITSEGLNVDGLKMVPPIFAYGAFRQYQSVGVEGAKKGGFVCSLFDTSRLLANPEQWLRGLNSADFSEVIRVLRIIFSVDSKFNFIQMDDGLNCLVIVTDSNDQTNPGKTPLHLASSGYRSLLAMVCDVLRGLMDPTINPYFESLHTAQAVVLIDEIEAHLHPRWKIRVMSALREALPKVTFIATSHDPLCLRGMHKGEVVAMRRLDGLKGDLSMKVECLADLPYVGRLTVEQLLTSDFFNLMSTDQPEMEFQLANVADSLVKRARKEPLSKGEAAAVKTFERDMREVLPIGSTEAQRLVQEAVAEFLKRRQNLSTQRMKEMRSEYREEIIGILERF